MVITLRVSERLVETLKNRKVYKRETYEEVIWNLIEDTMELNEETKRDIPQARVDIDTGRFYTHEQVKKRIF